MKFYAVKNGRVPGVYTSYAECLKQVRKFPNASYKAFQTENEAQNFIAPSKIQDTSPNALKVYFDGGCRSNQAGGACYIPSQNTVFYKRASPDPETKKETNNRGELTGLLLALKYTSGDIHIYGDSLYAIKVGSKEWQNKNNHDLVRKIHNRTKNRDIHWFHVPAHTGIEENELCDRYATKALQTTDTRVRKVKIVLDSFQI